jgi:SAM-dependent methyltransferase
MDLVREMVRAARTQAAVDGQRIRALAANLTSLPFREAMFDGVAMLGQVIAHVWGRDNRVSALRSVRSVLRPGGVLALTTHNRRCHWKFRLYFGLLNRLRRLARMFGYRKALQENDRWCRRISSAQSHPTVFLHMYDLEEAIADLEAAGFEVLQAQSRAEYESGRQDPAARQRDYLLGFIARRPSS